MRGDPVPIATLLDALEDKTVLGTLPATISGVAYDSRKVEAGDLFVAVAGLKQDGRRYVEEALGRGAAAVVLERPDLLEGKVTGRVLVPSSREALARLADAYFGHPSGALTVVGITGTNGKTTTSYLVDALFSARGERTGLIGTVQYRIGTEVVPAGQTTPEAVELQSFLRRMVDAGVTAVAMEVSSHALALSRVDGVDFDVAVFTNLTQDHLDFHVTMDAYREAKRRLFSFLAAGSKPGRTAVVNADDPAGVAMVAGLPLRALTYGIHGRADVRPGRWSSGALGIRMSVLTPAGQLEVASPLVGEHNVMNLLAAAGVGVALGMAPEAIGRALGSVGSVPGRFERVEAGQPFLVVVDYAHTPDALERTLETARKLVGPQGRLGVVFGCGGDRDRGKRPLMGAIAARLGDHVWITSDNPRTESPEAIIADIVAGIPAKGPGDPAVDRHETLPDRKAAIQRALGWAHTGDVVVIAGKGHETYQVIGSEVLPFDDRAQARAALAGRKT
jgi:UDP-N-acetylmuramoyl-L-alanyl-D-glutamate--2,6-diaminopimelate ligase